mgnify:CR=1 FL=1
MTDTTNTTLLDQMINNLGVTSKITTDDRNKLEKLKFSEYSNELRNADIEIGAQNIDNDLKIGHVSRCIYSPRLDKNIGSWRVIC